jgi:hypothetical protein
MSKFDEALQKYTGELQGMGVKVKPDLLKAVTKGLGPSLYRADSTLVACSDKEELERVKKNFLVKKLGLKDESSLDAAIQQVCQQYDKRQKHRAVFYYLLVEKMGKASVYSK